jgi:hypothetical protein
MTDQPNKQSGGAAACKELVLVPAQIEYNKEGDWLITGGRSASMDMPVVAKSYEMKMFLPAVEQLFRISFTAHIAAGGFINVFGASGSGAGKLVAVYKLALTLPSCDALLAALSDKQEEG